MPAEDPNQADDLLKRYATKRREQAGDFSLHSATRRLLQDEVARQHRPSNRAGASFPSWVGLWRNRIALSVAGATAVIVGLVIWNASNNEESMRLAKNERTETSLTEALSARPGAEDLGEKEKQVTLLSTPPAASDPAGGLRSKEKALSPLQAGNAPAGPAQQLQDAPAAQKYFDVSSDFSSTNLLAYNSSGTSRILGTAPSPSGTSLGDSLGVTLAMKPPERNEDETLSNWYASTSQVKLLADAKAAPTTNIPPQLPSNDGKRLGQVAQVNLGKEAEARTESFGVSLDRAGGQENLARNRALTLPQTAMAAEPVATSARPSDATAIGGTAKTPDEKPVAGLPSATVDSSLAAIESRSGLDADRPVFFSQSNLERLPEVSQRTDAVNKLEKKVDSTPRVLTRFTVEQRGETLRFRETDGSIYEGTISDGAETVAGDSKASQVAAKDELLRDTETTDRFQSANANTRSYYFRAAGSNVTLRQNVVVNGRLSTSEALIPESTRTGIGGVSGRPGVVLEREAGTASVRSTPAPRPTSPAASRQIRPDGGRGNLTNQISSIEGTVRVGPTNEERFRAVQAPR